MFFFVCFSLVHPLSPRGKLVHWGLEGLQTTSGLVKQAHLFNDQAILRDKLYRIATDDKQSQTLQNTADQLPGLATWLERDELLDQLNDETSPIVIERGNIQGGICLSNGCKVIHVPSYIDGLWQACQSLAEKSHSTLSWELNDGLSTAVDDSSVTSILCVGAAGFLEVERFLNVSLPAQLVRGHSVELNGLTNHAMSSGKYVSPMIGGRTLIGATHEFKLNEARTREQIIQELQERTAHMCRWGTENIHRITSGVRVQSERGAFGRRPMIGRVGENTWIFTGLSSRGLLYHGIYGKKLARAIIRDDESLLLEDCPNILWWKGQHGRT